MLNLNETKLATALKIIESAAATHMDTIATFKQAIAEGNALAYCVEWQAEKAILAERWLVHYDNFCYIINDAERRAKFDFAESANRMGRDIMRWEPQRSTSAMSNEIDRAQHLALKDFAQKFDDFMRFVCADWSSPLACLRF